MAASCQAGDPLLQERGSPSHPGSWRLLRPATALRTMALLRLPALPGPRARRGQCYGLSARGGLRRRVTSRYEPRLQAFGLEPRACSRYGWEFSFLVSFGASLFFSEPLRRNSSSNFPEIQISGRISHSFWDFSIRDRIYSQPRTTKGFGSVRAGTRISGIDD